MSAGTTKKAQTSEDDAPRLAERVGDERRAHHAPEPVRFGPPVCVVSLRHEVYLSAFGSAEEDTRVTMGGYVLRVRI
jgi:hypothetical protein